MGCAVPLVASLLAAVVPPDPTASDSIFQLAAVLTATPPAIDGVLSDGEWIAAALADRFIEYEPRRGSPSEYPTQALVLYDSTHLTSPSACGILSRRLRS